MVELGQNQDSLNFERWAFKKILLLPNFLSLARSYGDATRSEKVLLYTCKTLGTIDAGKHPGGREAVET